MPKVEQLQVLCKKLSIVTNLVQVVHDCSADGLGFAKVYDAQLASMSLPPVIDIAFPLHLQQARHALDITATEQVNRWIARTSSSELKKNGVQDLVEEQSRHYSEQFAALLRQADKTIRMAQLKEFFDISFPYEFEAPTVDVCVLLVFVCLSPLRKTPPNS